jgi:hypothetical protein
VTKKKCFIILTPGQGLDGIGVPQAIGGKLSAAVDKDIKLFFSLVWGDDRISIFITVQSSLSSFNPIYGAIKMSTSYKHSSLLC